MGANRVSDAEPSVAVAEVSTMEPSVLPSEHRARSQAWCAHFAANSSASENLPWNDSYRLSSSERRAIRNSIQQFQLGEGSEGRRLLARADAYSHSAADPHFREALALFIKEEQGHSAHLLRFMLREEIPAVTAHWVDSVFRLLRGLAGLELSLRVLVTAETIAVPYYRALRRATKSSLLHAISSKILQDEATHLKFQASLLSRLATRRSPLGRALLCRAQRFFLIGTCWVVWIHHRTVFAAAKYTFREFWREALAGLSDLESAMGAGRSAEPVRKSSAKISARSYGRRGQAGRSRE